MLPARHTGIRLSAPAELFIDSAFTGAELLSDVTSPWAPAHSALRAIAPKVAHVGHAVQHDEQGRFVLGNRFEQLVQADVLDGRRQRYGALMVTLREPVQLFDRDPLHPDPALPAQFGQLAEQYAVGPFLQIDFLDLPSGLDRLDDRAAGRTACSCFP